MPGVVIIGGAWGKSEHPKERSDQKPFVKRQIHVRRPDPKALTLLQRLLFPHLICGCSGTNASPDRYFLIIPTLRLLKNSIDVNKLSVCTPNTRYACSLFAQLRGGLCEAARPQAGASRKGNIVLIVPLDPAYKAGLAGHLPVKCHG